MSVYRQKSFLTAGIVFGLVFAVLFSIRLDLFGKIVFGPAIPDNISPESVPERDTWMSIYQKDRKIGYSHKRFFKEETGFTVQETVFMRINTMGMIQDIHLNTKGRLHPDFTLSGFDFEINSGRFSFSAHGRVDGKVLAVRTESAGVERKFKVKLRDKPFLVAGLVDAVGAYGLKPGDRIAFNIFDPVSMGQEPVNVSVMDQENIRIMGIDHKATKMLLNFKGANQFAWIGENGEILKEKGLLGIRLEKTTRAEAVSDFKFASSEDLTRLASISSNVKFESPDTLDRVTVKINGIDIDTVHLNGGRQTLAGNILTIKKESLTDLPSDFVADDLALLEKIFLNPGPFIQSDHEKIQQAIEGILQNGDGTSLSKAKKLVHWIHVNVEKRPVLSLPDALSTLENKVGDCNEHAVLLAAMARAAGIPARIETGLVYMRGRFYYHAWNLLYLGEWITADAVLGQLPADVTHIRFASGSGQQFDLMGVIGKVKIEVVTR